MVPEHTRCFFQTLSSPIVPDPRSCRWICDEYSNTARPMLQGAESIRVPSIPLRMGVYAGPSRQGHGHVARRDRAITCGATEPP
jgi:hypothetical protein